MRFIAVIIVLLANTSCTKDYVNVNFQVEGASNAIIVRIDGEHTVPWDTIKVVENQLKINLPLDSTRKTFYYFLFNTGASLRIGIEPNDDISGYVDASASMTKYDLKGSKLSEQLLALYKPVLESSIIIDSLDEFRKLNKDIDSSQINMESRHYKCLENRYFSHKNEILKIMEIDSSNLSNVFGFFQKVAAAPLFTSKKEDYIYFQEFGDAIIKKHRNHPLAQIFILERKRMLRK